MLVTAQDLAERINSGDWLVFDCRHDLLKHEQGRRLYDEGHLPGAHFAPVETVLSGPKTAGSGRHPLPVPADFAAWLQTKGVTPLSRVVAYDDVGGLYAARFWWMCRQLGLTQVHLLDGGLPAWVASGFSLSTTEPRPTASSVPLPSPSTWPTVVATEAVLRHLGDYSWFVVDARAAERYRGDVEPIDPVGGHIPGAVNHFYKNNLRADQSFRRPEELRALWLELLGEKPASAVVHQCGSGITACANQFAMELAGLSGSRVYAGSWSAWVSDPGRPVAKGASPG